MGGEGMESQFERSEMILGEGATARLMGTKVAVFGVGGVGGYVVEALARAGVGELWLIDPDTVSVTNFNRQIVALHSTIGREKVSVMAERAADINPNCKIKTYKIFYSYETAADIDLSGLDYVVDAIDSVSSKICLVEHAKAAGVPIICAMGAGNKLNPMGFEVADISKTSVCPLARVMRIELKKRGISGIKAVYSKEQPCKNPKSQPGDPPGSLPFVPGAAGLLIASEVVRDLLGEG